MEKVNETYNIKSLDRHKDGQFNMGSKSAEMLARNRNSIDSRRKVRQITRELV